MATIRSLQAIEILDSRGNPTVQTTLTTDSGLTAVAAVPSGASTGEHEAVELRDKDNNRYLGKGVLQAVKHVNGPINDLLIGENVFNQRKIDLKLLDAEGTEHKSRWGANAILSASLAVARAGALAANLPLYQYLGGVNAHLLPRPMMNIINGGAHADNGLDFQEFMIVPHGASTFSEALRWGAEIFHMLKKILRKNGSSTAVGDEGGFAPSLESNEATLNMILMAINEAGYSPGNEVSIALDCAASEFYDKGKKLYVEKKKKQMNLPHAERNYRDQTKYLKGLISEFPIVSIEDPLDENDWEGWAYLSNELKGSVQIVGDDLYVTNRYFLKKGIEKGIANAILIKLNQIGTVTETLDTIHLAHYNGYKTIISHRSGETEDTFIADFAVATGSGQIKTGSLSRTDRVAKYNRLLTIENELGSAATYNFEERWQTSEYTAGRTF